ncbi:hypothetical protein G7054_g7475 [Neopestalotiopsis clavispora]|nr:hypothetical protein G7054_g7475 [Neopestalotiopsis clavispora]
MRASTLIASVAAIAGTAYASPQAIISVESPHGGANSAASNQTIYVPLNTVYTDPKNLYQVSKLYLTGAKDAAVETITCNSYQGTDGTGAGGKTFSFGTPSFLSTNSVQVGSIVCKSTSSTTSIGGTTAGTTSTGASVTLIAPTTTAFGTFITSATEATGTGAAGSATVTVIDGTTSVITATGTTTTSAGNGTSPVQAGAAGLDLPYMMSALVLGAAGLMYAM